jgi:septal ring factor EnvC (AmiA/AmiB activator)
MFASLLGSAVRKITERLSGFDDSLAATNATQVDHASRLSQLESTIAVQARTIHQLTERLDIARNERFAVDQSIKRVSYDMQTAHVAIFARLTGHDSLIKAQDEAIASLDSVDSMQGELINKQIKVTDALRSDWHLHERAISALEFANSNACAGHKPEASETHSLLSKIHEIQRAHNADFETVNKANAELSDRIESVYQEMVKRTDSLAEETVSLRGGASNMTVAHARLMEKVTDLIASLQYTGAPAEFVRYTHAADLAEVVRKIVRVELNSFDFSPRIDIAVRDAATRALTNMTNDRRQFGSFTMGTTTKSNVELSEPHSRRVHVQHDADGKPIHFTADGKGVKPE